MNLNTLLRAEKVEDIFKKPQQEESNQKALKQQEL